MYKLIHCIPEKNFPAQRVIFLSWQINSVFISTFYHSIRLFWMVRYTVKPVNPTIMYPCSYFLSQGVETIYIFFSHWCLVLVSGLEVGSQFLSTWASPCFSPCKLIWTSSDCISWVLRVGILWKIKPRKSCSILQGPCFGHLHFYYSLFIRNEKVSLDSVFQERKSILKYLR